MGVTGHRPTVECDVCGAEDQGDMFRGEIKLPLNWDWVEFGLGDDWVVCGPYCMGRAQEIKKKAELMYTKTVDEGRYRDSV